MSSFPAQMRKVLDEASPLLRRRVALRGCLYYCRPYGFEPTWNHLVESAGIPQRIEDDPESLVRAVEELREVRDVVLPLIREHVVRRGLEKAAGFRRPRRSQPWYSWGWTDIALCPDPRRRPAGRLADVVRGVLERHAAGVDPDEWCLACGTARDSGRLPCAVCGVCAPGQRGR